MATPRPAPQPTETKRPLPVLLSAALARHPSPGPQCRRLEAALAKRTAEEITTTLAVWWWRTATDPVALAVFFPEALARDGLGSFLRGYTHPDVRRSSPGFADLARRWEAQEADLEHPDNSLRGLLTGLAAGVTEPAETPRFYARLFALVDRLHALFVDPSLTGLLRDVERILHEQTVGWSDAYTGGYAYQGLESAGIQGWKPSERRWQAFRADEFLTPAARVFDIGANCGLLAVHLAERVARVDGIDINPYLLRIGERVAAHMGRENVNLVAGDFATHATGGGYDLVLSLANHQTTDRRLAMPFSEYVMRCWSLLAPGGRLLFESHDVFGPGRGGPGDDGDLEAKFDVMEQWFELERHHMVRRFVPTADVDKLFAVLRRRDEPATGAVRTLDLGRARGHYLD